MRTQIILYIADTPVTLAIARATSVSDNIPARSFALLSHRLPSSQPLACIIALLRLASCFSIMSSYSLMYIYSSVSLSISPPNSLVVFVTLTKVKAVLA